VSTPGRNLLVLGDYPVGFANGIGETLDNLLGAFPDERLVEMSPSHFAPAPGRERGRSVTFTMPRRPAWVPRVLHRAYYPVLKAQQALAERALVAEASRVIHDHHVGAVLTYPVTPWVLFAAVRLRRQFPDVRFVFYVMDDWEGHHTCFGLPFTARRRAALNEMVATADVRFACSARMRADYEQRFTTAWQVLHKGMPSAVPPGVAPRPLRQPWRILYAGGLNVFRADAVLAFAEGLRRFRAATGQDVTLTLLGAAGDRAGTPELQPYDFVRFEPWVDNAACQQRLAAADLLYLPLSFLPHVERIAHLAMPTKFGDYLAADRPVIFHVPQASEVCDLASGAGLPLTITTTDPDAICRDLQSLEANPPDPADYRVRSQTLLRDRFAEPALRQRLHQALFPERES
jgi:hypothetical protein